MNSTFLPFTLTILAGLSTLLGYLVVFIKRNNHNKIIVSSLGFASGVMVSTSILDLVPESLNILNKNLSTLNTIVFCFLGLIFGIVISMIIDYYVPDNYNNNSLFRIGLLSMIAIILHNIPEGIATFMATSNNIHLGTSLATAIAIHNIPEGISISIPIYYSTESKNKAFIYTLISALSEPFGAVLAFILLKNIMNDMILGLLFSIIAGIMLEISLRTLIPNAKKYNDNKSLYSFFIIGFILMICKFLL